MIKILIALMTSVMTISSASVATEVIEQHEIESHYDLEQSFEDGISISLETTLGGNMCVSYNDDVWGEKTIEELNATIIEHVSTMLDEDSERFKEVKSLIDGDTDYYKTHNVHNIPIKDAHDKLAELNEPKTE